MTQQEKTKEISVSSSISLPLKSPRLQRALQHRAFPALMVFFIVCGVLLNMASVLINSHYISDEQMQIDAMRAQVAAKDRQIEERWQILKTLEYKEDFVRVYVTLHHAFPAQTTATNMAVLERHVQKMLSLANCQNEEERKGVMDAMSNPQELLTKLYKMVDRFRRESLDAIDMMYIERLDLEGKANQMRDDLRMLSNLAVFFQVLGLALVLLPPNLMKMRSTV